MLFKKDIKNWTNATIYSRGTDVYYSGHVNELNIVNMINGVEIVTRVKGSGQKIYGVSVTVDEVRGELIHAFCECPAFYSYSGICKHCAAVLMKYIDQNNVSERRRPEVTAREMPPVVSSSAKRMGGIPSGSGRKKNTTPGIRQILQKQTYIRSLPIMRQHVHGRVKLIPLLYCDNREIRLEFQIGISQMYVLKDIYGFVDAMRDQREVSYGKKLEFIHVPQAFEPEYRQLVKWLCDWTVRNGARRPQQSGRTYYMSGSSGKLRTMSLGGQELQELLEALPREPLQARVQGWADSEWNLTDEPFTRKLSITGAGEGVELEMEDAVGYRGNQYLIYFAQGLIYRIVVEEAEQIGDFISCMTANGRRAYIGKDDLSAFCRELLPSLKTFFQCTIVNLPKVAVGIKNAEFSFYLDSPRWDHVSCKILAQYGEEKYNVYDFKSAAGIRDWDSERQAVELASEYFQTFLEKDMALALVEDEEKLFDLMSAGISRLQEFGTVYSTTAVRQASIVPAPKIALGVSLLSNMLELTITSGDMPYDYLAEVLCKYDRKKKYYRLRDGSFINMEDKGIDALAELKKGLDLSEEQLRRGIFRMPRFRALYLEEELKEWPGVTAETNRNFKALVRNMSSMDNSSAKVPEELDGVLREYQKTGFLWMKTLKQNGLGGILADDMGLGKTLQVIALLMSEFQEEKGENKRSLIVTPASLVYNWKAEIEKFAPALPVKMVVGTAQERMELISGAGEREILITSYDLLKRDLEYYGEKEFACQIIDEAQYIKNHSTQAARAVKEINAGYKLALTGTPLENRLSELWSIFDYLCPGLLYSYTRFREELELPIVQDGDEKVLKRLQKIIRPFVLRRLKKDVLKDLPDKLEENMFVMLGGEQQQLYDAHVIRLRKMLNGQTEEEFNHSKIQILAELTRLRQLCCDPSLVMEGYEEGSAKSDMCMDLLLNAVNGGHKVLLFSQFTSMLENLTKRMEQEGISYFTLTGATSKERRRELVERFNQDDTSVFCISLKAGGCGLNLTAADIVIHYDPWWNISVQNQATDRAHRIGQTNIVTVFKLIVKNTIEENILKLQEKKKELAEQVLNGEDMGSGSFTREELLELLTR